MATNNTTLELLNSIEIYVFTIISVISVIIATVTCLIIILLIYITPNLHSPTNLLVCNTSSCTLFYIIIAMVNVLMFYNETTSSDWSCRVRGYLYYVSLNLVIHSYVIQAISRLFWTVLYRYRYLLTMKCHVYLIIVQICLSFLLPSTIIITKDVVFRSHHSCLIPIQYAIHVLYQLAIAYIIPFGIIIVLYVKIYRHTVRSTANFQRSSHRNKRDMELARNILILLGIFLFSGFPTILYMIVANKVEVIQNLLFLIATTTPTVAIAIEKILTIKLNKDLRNALKLKWIRCFPNCCRLPTTRVQPFTYPNTTQRRTIPTISGINLATNIRNS